MISVITPVHAPSARYLIDAYRSLCAQSVDGWEWVITVTSEGVEIPSEISGDPRVRVVEYTVGLFPAAGQIGRFKREACAAASGEWLLELDADDELFPAALERVQEAFAAGAGFVSSDCAYWLDKGAEGYESRWETYPFAPECGWVDPYPVTFRGMELLAQHAAPVNPQNLRLIDYAPDHLRAWSRAAYDAVGGHDAALEVCDDHDLMVRMYLDGARFVQIPECLYAHRMHAENTTDAQHAAIRAGTQAVYSRNVAALAEKFAADNDLLSVDMGAIARTSKGKLKLPDNSVGFMRAIGVLERDADQIGSMNEIARVLAPGGFLHAQVPSTNGVGAHGDPRHRSYWNRLSFLAFCGEAMISEPRYTGRFHILRMAELFPSEWHREMNFPVVQTQLCKLGPNYRPFGPV